MLRKLGLEDQLDRYGHAVAGYKLLSHDGDLIQHMDFASLAPECIATTSIERPDLHRILLEAVSPQCAVQFSTKIISCSNTENGVEVLLNNGSKETYDLVVAADGVHSYLRSILFPDVHEKFYGMHSWLISVDKPEFIPVEIVHHLAAGAYAVQYPHGTERCGVYFAARAEPGKYTKEYDGRHELAEIFKDFEPPITDIIAEITDDTPMFHDYIRKVENHQNYSGRIALIGDAEHAMSPLLGQGSSLVMEDALVLAEELLAPDTSIDAALVAYQDRRYKRVKEIQQLSNIFMDLMKINSKIEEEVVWGTVKHFAPPSLLLDVVMKRVERQV